MSDLFTNFEVRLYKLVLSNFFSQKCKSLRFFEIFQKKQFLNSLQGGSLVETLIIDIARFAINNREKMLALGLFFCPAEGDKFNFNIIQGVPI